MSQKSLAELNKLHFERDKKLLGNKIKNADEKEINYIIKILYNMAQYIKISKSNIGFIDFGDCESHCS